MLLWPLLAIASINVGHLRVENLEQPLGIDTTSPRFSWQITATGGEQDVVQTAYEIIVLCDGQEVWNSGRVTTSQQLWIPYSGSPLRSGQHLTWKVKVYTNRGETTWSEEQRFSIGLLTESQWSGRWIGLEHLQPGEVSGQLFSRLAARYLRKVFQLQQGKQVKRATAYVCGLGFYRLFIGGQEVGANDMLKPAPSDYRRSIYYNTYDVTENMADSFTVGVILGNGKYFAPRQDKPYKNTVFGLPKCRLNIIVEFTDGSQQRFSTDEKWRVTTNGPIRANNEYDGEEYDARMELHGWLTTTYDDSSWLPADRTALPTGTLRPQMIAPTSPTSPTPPTSPTISTLSTSRIYDFRQNTAGWVSLLPQGRSGDTIRVRYSERLNADGTLYVNNLRNARSTDIYICNGDETQPWHPSFVYHGFRYVEVTGPATQVQAWTVSDNMENTGTFLCSDTILNKVMEAARQGIISNYKNMPVDCPQRNERQPWLGDRTVGSLGESFLFSNERLYTKWMRDICESQRSDGVFSDVAPAYWNYYNDDVTWPAVLPFTCDMLYRQYGNSEAIIESYPAMKRWMEHLLTDGLRDGLIIKDKYGDWCMPPERLDLIHSQDPARQTDGTLIATAYTIRTLQLMQIFASMQGLSEDATRWEAQRQQLIDAFNRLFLHAAPGTSLRPGHPLYPDSTYYGNNTCTANLLPVAFGIVPENLKQEVMKQVVTRIFEDGKGHISCGVIGISWLMRALADNGYNDVACHLATQRTYPSWGYMTENGATTIWELWNGDKADPAMNSGNHVMLLGDLITWAYQYIGGIRQETAADTYGRSDADVAHKNFIIAPDWKLQELTHAAVTYRTPYGPIESRWQKTLQHAQWQVTIPCNTTATVVLPNGENQQLGSGTYSFSMDIPTANADIIRDEFPYTEASFASPHATTIVETRKGDLVVAYFGGTYERNPDCCIWVNIKKHGRNEWSQPILAARGIGDNGEPVACWNPVLTEMPSGELWLFYKVGVNVVGWTGWLTKSKNGGRTWSRPEQLPDGFLGPIKNKPLLVGDNLLCGSSTEAGGWRFHVEVYNIRTKQWSYVGPVESTLAPPTANPDTLVPIDCIQPSFLQLADGRLQVLMRSRNGKLATSFSSDQGKTWTPVILSELPNNQSGTDAVTLRDGRHVLVYNNFETLPGTPKGPRTPLSLAISDDDGLTWRHLMTLEDSPVQQYSYPAIIEGRDGTLHVTYTWRRKRVGYKQVRIAPRQSSPALP
jgi:alpha-L-rhamnosidase